MTINERIKKVRKEKKLNQKQFAATLGVTQSGASYMEQPGNNVSDSSIKTICAAFGLNEEWLRTGADPMYIEPDTFSLDEFVKQRGATDLELQIVKTYFDLDADTRKVLVAHFKKSLASAIMEDPAMIVPDTPEELEADCPPLDLPGTSGKDAG
ncbi:MAG: helix-turn-helix domain-containing protein [Muribaculum sp.]|nr:helix-turn-helix domain-containing protein [Muribaculum sp.]